MHKDTFQEAVRLVTKNRHRRIWRKIVGALACIVVFCTTYALILPAITAEKKTSCGQTEHIHSAACYTQVMTESKTVLACTPESLNLHRHTDVCMDGNGAYRCGYADFAVHVHDASCFDQEGDLRCSLPEIKAHTHCADCYAAPNAETQAHVHTENCYALQQGELTCRLTEEHEHSEACYAWEQVLVCELPAEPEEGTEPAEQTLNCGMEEMILHTHEGGCFNEEGNLICGKQQVLEHVHSEACFQTVEEPADTETLTCRLEENEDHRHDSLCYGTWELTCGLEEHTHGLACFADPTADVETAENWEQTFASVELSGIWAEDVLTIAQSQLGYQESAANYIVKQDGVTTKGYTRYGAWYGDPYGDWDAMFVSFCLHYANVPEKAFHREASCPKWVEALEKQEIYAPAGGEYKPGAGDVVFFDEDADGLADHVGLVRELRWSGETGEMLTGFTTIEGDCGNQVAEREYTVDDASILGYGVLSMLSETVQQAESGAWGYNADGSIWWNLGSVLTPTTEIQENTPYAIAGYNGNNVIGDAVYEKGGYQYLEAMPTEDITDYELYQRWYFERQADGTYHIYFRKNNQDGSTEKRYLQFGGAGMQEWNTPTQQLVLTADAAQATAFTISQKAGHPEHFTISKKIGDRTYYVNAYFGDRKKGDTNPDGSRKTTHFLGYPDDSEGSLLRVCQYEKEKIETANRLDTTVSANTVINFFDYWTAASQTDRDDVDYWNGGINQDHSFKFYKHSSSYWAGDNKNCGTMNALEAHAVVRTGIVQKTLGENGYPVLSGDQKITGGSTESLDYLFDPKKASPGKEAFPNVKGLLRVNEDGYYYFSSRETMAEYKRAENVLAVYDRPGVFPNGSGDTSDLGQFFPMNAAPQVMMKGSVDPIMNHYMGLTITTRFIQRYGGHSDASWKTPTTYSFAGDDDVWIFIDNVLVADLGGAHASVGVDIDFSTGNIITTHSDGSGKPLTTTTTLRAVYQSANAENKTRWSQTEPNTFADNTTHTLKFFYLERGNYDSNLYLQYNLTEIPETVINKVNQYGEEVEGATFAVYAADQNYNMLSQKNGYIVTVPDDPQYDEAGNILDPSGGILAHALYTGTTNAQGEMLFVDSDEMPYSLTELEDIFGSRFILREIKAPDGYRVVSKDVNLEIWHGGSQTILKCNNTQHSGSRAAATLQVTATDTLHLVKPYYGSNVIQYCDNQGQSTGTLFAVVFKYVGAIDENGNATGVNSDENWAPVYGNELKGYHLVDMENKSLLAGALEAAREARKYGDVEFKLSPSSTMQLMMENLPGNITTYYRILSEDQKGQARYSVGYYWTPGTLDKADENSLYRVNTFDSPGQAGQLSSAFDRIFGANIQVPNLVNRVLVQKVDEKNNLIDGATFALYQVEQGSDGVICYRTEDGSYVRLGDHPQVGTDGTITDGVHTVKPLKTGITRTWEDGVHVGTTGFSNLNDGQYIIKEVNAPPGYQLNTADVMVLITEDTIYANAGTADDGITVGRGPGYVVSTLDKFASLGQLDNTLSWIYAQLRITAPSTSFTDAEDESKYVGYLTQNNSCETSPNEADAIRSYLKYKSTDGEAVFNYVPNEERSKVPGTQHPTETRRLFTTAGWSSYEIYQDYEYGKTAKSSTANYEDWSTHNITNLFSRSTYIRVRDIQETDLQVKKVSANNKTVPLTDAKFRLYRQENGKAPEYYCRVDGTISWETNQEMAFVVTTGEDGVSKEMFTKLPDGTYYLEEIQAPTGYRMLSKPVALEIYHANMTILNPSPVSSEDLEAELREDNSYLYTITIPNSTGYELPATGGIGTTPYTVGGLLLICFALLLLYRKRRKTDSASF